MSDHSLPPDDPLTPPLSSDGRSGSPTPVSPSPGPPPWTNEGELPEPFDPPAGGRYQAHSFHKPGGMGRVWRARDAELGRDVAFKEIRPKFADKEWARRRFMFEAEVTGRLEHPAVIPVYGFGHDVEGRPYYAMRFVEGKSLQEALVEFYSTNGPSGAERVVVLRRLLGHFVTVCRAIHYAHSRGIIHRDLKPDNIMVGDFGETLVVDWGIAKRLRAAAGEEVAAPVSPVGPEGPPDQSHSQTGHQIGTKKYWSPEQAAGVPNEHDERTDVYGLGAVLFAILTGTPPNPPSGVHAPEPPSPRAHCPSVDPGIDQITRTALALDRKDRYQTAADVAHAVEQWLAEQPLLAQRAAVEALSRAADDPTDFTSVELFARQRSNLGLMLAGTGRDAEAATEFWEAANVFARLAHENRQPRFLAEEANCLLAMARALKAVGRDEEAETAGRRAARIYKRLRASHPEMFRSNIDSIMQSASQVDIDISEARPRPGSSDFELKIPLDSDSSDVESRNKTADPNATEGTSAPARPREPDTDVVIPAEAEARVIPDAVSDSSADIDLGAITPDPAVSRAADPGSVLVDFVSIHDLPELEPAAPSEPAPAPLASTDPVIELPSEAAASVPDLDLMLDSSAAPSVPDINILYAPPGGRPAAPAPFKAGDHAIPDFELPPVPPDYFTRATGREPPQTHDSIPDIDSLFPPAAPEPPAVPGAFLGLSSGYTRLRDLAQGGMGRLYLARDENLNRLVVIKTLADAHATDSRAAQRFRREIQITGSLEHPNLVRAYASGTGDGGRPYMVLEYLTGSTLVRQLGARGPGWSAALLDPLAQVCEGVHHAHTRGIVHRDAKLSNIIVQPLGRTVLVDWGLGKVIGQPDGLDSGIGVPVESGDDDPMRSQAGALVGTPAYMAPEQARGDAAAVGPWTDVFTLGVDLFHLVTGHPPGHQYDLRELIARRRVGDLPHVRDVRPDAPGKLDAICARAMAFRPEDRHPSAAALAADLRAFLAARGGR